MYYYKQANTLIEAIADGNSWIYRQTHVERDDAEYTLRLMQKAARDYLKNRAVAEKATRETIQKEAAKYLDEEGYDIDRPDITMADFAFHLLKSF